MILRLFPALMLLLATSAIAADFTKRSVTDPMLKISTSSTLLPEKDDPSLGARRDEDAKPPMYRRIFGRANILMLEPFSREKPAEIDFSAITSSTKGTLRIAARNHPAGDFQIQIFKGGQLFAEKSTGRNQWQNFTIPFDHEPVVVKNMANGWHYEHGFIDYSFAR